MRLKQGFVVNITDFMHILVNSFSHNRSLGIVHKGAFYPNFQYSDSLMAHIEFA